MLDAGLEIVSPEGRSQMNQTGAVFRGDEVSADHHSGLPILR
jgi:hypothetical protein